MRVQLLIIFVGFLVSLADTQSLTLFSGCNLTSTIIADWRVGYKDFWPEEIECSDEKTKDECFESEQEVMFRISVFMNAHNGRLCSQRIETISQTLFTLKDRDQKTNNAPNIVEKARGVIKNSYGRKVHNDLWTVVFRVWYVTDDPQVFYDTMSDQVQQAVSSSYMMKYDILVLLLSVGATWSLKY